MNRFKGTKTYTSCLNGDKVSVDYVCSNLDDEYIITAVWYNGVDVQNIINEEDFNLLEEEVNNFENDY